MSEREIACLVGGIILGCVVGFVGCFLGGWLFPIEPYERSVR